MGTKSFMKHGREVDRTTIIENTDDLCVQVAMENTGAVWNGNNMKSSDFAKIVISKFQITFQPLQVKHVHVNLIAMDKLFPNAFLFKLYFVLVRTHFFSVN